mmetsp:Transcript_53809/g.99467  ORF Transcript_53809/g.99467 Transcript_53809/m.99467 type:complete len:84 (+) Transcript_53809:624-875(+)
MPGHPLPVMLEPGWISGGLAIRRVAASPADTHMALRKDMDDAVKMWEPHMVPRLAGQPKGSPEGNRAAAHRWVRMAHLAVAAT